MEQRASARGRFGGANRDDHRRRRSLHGLIRHEADHDERDRHVEDRADDQRSEDADRHVLLRVLRFLRGHRHGVEPDVSEEDDAGASEDAAPSVLTERAGVRRDERVPVRRVDVGRAAEDDDQHDADFHDDDPRVDVG